MRYLISLFLLLLIPGQVFAELPKRLADDFSPLEGYIVLPVGSGEYLIDLDAGKGAHLGDIFTVLGKGRKVTHPVTGEIIGEFHGESAFLQVTRLKSGFSYVRKLSGNAAVKKGDKIQRFLSVPARYISNTAHRGGLKFELQKKLNFIDWQNGKSEIPALLVFEQNRAALLVKNSDGTVLFEYRLAETESPVAAPGSRNAAPAASVFPAPVSVEPSPAEPDKVGIIRNPVDTTKIWHGAEYRDNVVGLRIDDFNQDKARETALLLKSSLVISRYTFKSNKPIAVLPLKTGIDYLAIDSIDLNRNGKPEIFLSAVRKGVPASAVYELDGQHLTKVAGDLPMLFRRIEHPTRGSMLLGQQRWDLEVPFSERPFQVVFANGQYQAGPAYAVPAPINIYGYAPFVAVDQTGYSVYLSDKDHLKIKTGEGNDVYESAEYFGGSEVSFELENEEHDAFVIPYFIPERVLVNNGKIMVPQNDGQRIARAWRRYSKSRIIALKWNGLALDEVWRTSDQAGQTADFAFADMDNDGQAELVLAVNFTRKELFKTPKAAIIVYEMN